MIRVMKGNIDEKIELAIEDIEEELNKMIKLDCNISVMSYEELLLIRDLLREAKKNNERCYY